MHSCPWKGQTCPDQERSTPPDKRHLTRRSANRCLTPSGAGENQKARFCLWFSAGEHPKARFCPRLARYRARPEITKRQIAHAAPADAEAVWRISSKKNLKARFCSRFSARGSVRDSLPKRFCPRFAHYRSRPHVSQKADSSLQRQPMLDAVWWFSAGENVKARFCSGSLPERTKRQGSVPCSIHYRVRPDINQKADSSLQHQLMLDLAWWFSAGENRKASREVGSRIRRLAPREQRLTVQPL